jgi:hypothetical protein
MHGLGREPHRGRSPPHEKRPAAALSAFLEDVQRQNPYVERLIGSIRRELPHHVIVYSDSHLKRLLRSYFVYYLTARTHLALDKQCPQPRLIERRERGKTIASRTLAVFITSTGVSPDPSGNVTTPVSRFGRLSRR